MAEQKRTVPLVVAAQRRGKSYRATLDDLLRGVLKGWKDDNGRWCITEESIARSMAPERVRRRGEPLNAA